MNLFQTVILDKKTTPVFCLLQTLMQSEGAVACKAFKIVTRIKTLYRNYIAILYRVRNITAITLRMQIQARIGNERNPPSDHSDIPQPGSHCNRRGRIQRQPTQQVRP